MDGDGGPRDSAAGSSLRAIDVPIEELPRVDEHAIVTEVSQAATWEALIPALRRAFAGPAPAAIARGLGCRETETAGDPRHPGATLPGFVVARAVPPTLYALLGVHRFSRYALVFSVDRLAPERSRVRAETRADFSGRSGSAYRALVIGTRAHVVVLRRLLAAVRRRTER